MPSPSTIRCHTPQCHTHAPCISGTTTTYLGAPALGWPPTAYLLSSCSDPTHGRPMSHTNIWGHGNTSGHPPAACATESPVQTVCSRPLSGLRILKIRGRLQLPLPRPSATATESLVANGPTWFGFGLFLVHITGLSNTTDNQVADCLSRYYKADGPKDHHPDPNFISVDTKLDPDRELLPIQHYIELCSVAARQSHRLAEQTEQCVLGSDQLNAMSSPTSMGPDNNDSPLAIQAGADGQSLHTCVEWQVDLAHIM